ncbi:MAG: hypothetical protein A2V65_02535 [Deltaproteobacteria bacterium RBG_13_49_15]|nr:MAG: hypothetical protein A2V65_02535 [Deltaproteobacteria bacterium RBG_13_49_15]
MSENHKDKRDYAGFLFVAVMILAIVGSGYYLIRIAGPGTLFRSIESVTRLLDDLPSLDSLQRKIPFKAYRTPPKEVLKDRQFVRRGYDLYMQNHFEQAIEPFNQALSINPNNPEAYYWRGRTWIKMEKNDAAIDDFKKALDLRPNHSESCDNLGWLYMRKGDYDNSISYLNRSIELSPENSWAYYNRGFVYDKKGDMAKALSDAEKACRLGFDKGCEMLERHRKTGKKGK